VAVPTKDVFAALALPRPLAGEVGAEGVGRGHARTIYRSSPTPSLPRERGREHTELVAALMSDRNDLEAPAISLQPVIANVLSELRAALGCELARMSGSGATCFGLFASGRAAKVAAQALRSNHPDWWIRATVFG